MSLKKFFCELLVLHEHMQILIQLNKNVLKFETRFSRTLISSATKKGLQQPCSY